jgi:hypothetical protein
MKTTLAILGIFVAAALVAGTVAITDSYAITLKFQNNKNGAQNNQNAGQASGIGQSNNVGGGSYSITSHNLVGQKNTATVSQSQSQSASNTCSGSFSC